MSYPIDVAIRAVTQHTSMLGEGPVWDAINNTICWVDILNGEIHEYDVVQEVFRTISVGQMIGSFVLRSDRNFIAALHHGFAFIDRKSGLVEMITDPEEHLPGNRFNDGECDPAGRFWAGTMALSEEEGAGSLYMIDHRLKPERMIDNVTISNGMAWSGDHQTFYYIDTLTQQVVAYEYDKHSGRIGNKRIVIRIETDDGYPDGMTIDAEGMLWIAHWNGWQVTRWNPKTGEKLSHIKLPVAKVTSCAFGGEHLEDLYITTAKVDLTPEELHKQPLAGSLFVVSKCGYRGVRPTEFRM
jgi:sugar lactone lactonase YvrE